MESEMYSLRRYAEIGWIWKTKEKKMPALPRQP